MRNFRELILVCTLLTAGAVMVLRIMPFGSTEFNNSVCRNNLIQLYKANILYQNNNNGIIIPRIDRTNKHRWRYWPQILCDKYCGDPMIFYCPANPKSEKMFDTDPLEPKTFAMGNSAYGMNYTLGNYKAYGSDSESTLTRLKDAANPSYMIFLGDSNTSELRATLWCWKRDYAPVHSDRSNFAMLDGSVRQYGKSELGLALVGKGKTWDGWKLDAKRWVNP